MANQGKDMVVPAEGDNAMDAYNPLQEVPVNLVFLDIEMDGMTGLELTKNLGKTGYGAIYRIHSRGCSSY